MKARRRAAAIAALGTLVWTAAASAQCRPPANSHEARLLAFYEAPIVFSMAAAPDCSAILFRSSIESTIVLAVNSFTVRDSPTIPDARASNC